MKKLVLIFLMVGVSICAQSENKGSVSLTFNGEKIDLPINTITLKKENSIVVTARAEKNNENVKQLINLELGLKKLTTDKSLDIDNSFLFEFRTNKTSQRFGNVFLLSFDMEKGSSNVEFWENNKKKEMASFNLKITILRITFVENRLQIKGVFAIKSRSEKSEKPLKPVVEIEDGEFEIII